MPARVKPVRIVEYGGPTQLEINSRQIEDLSSAAAIWRERLNLKRDPFTVRKVGGIAEVETQDVCGVIKVGELEVEVVPKFLDRTESRDWRSALLNILAHTGDLIDGVELTSVASTSARSLADLFAYVVLQSLEQAAPGGLPRGYVERAERLPFLRGHIDVARIIDLVTYPHSPPCIFDELTFDTDIGQLIKWAVMTLQADVVSPELFTRLEWWQTQMAEITNQRADKFSAQPRTLPLQYQSLVPAVRISELLLQGRGLSHSSGDDDAPGFLWNSSVVFEKFFDQLVRDFCKRRTGYSFSSKPIVMASPAKDEDLPSNYISGKAGLKTYPDQRILKDERTVLLLDTKYKVWNEQKDSPEPSDSYQVVAGGRFAACTQVALVYPAPKSGKRAPTAWVFSGTGNPGRMSAIFVDLVEMASPFGFRRLLADLETELTPLLDQAFPSPSLNAKNAPNSTRPAGLDGR